MLEPDCFEALKPMREQPPSYISIISTRIRAKSLVWEQDDEFIEKREWKYTDYRVGREWQRCWCTAASQCFLYLLLNMYLSSIAVSTTSIFFICTLAWFVSATVIFVWASLGSTFKNKYSEAFWKSPRAAVFPDITIPCKITAVISYIARIN